ncbi:uncharacterized protein MONOS_11053p2 [Monocercomonoides exilis]|uniref:uncharacterized protein n=1 Tax=Monocercomonoides exilis TaxID=2049356 RepID=UPI003559EDF4|nr:hypothetical protein MONOS_11053p2 [Monocercomonoides exilis]
MSELEDCIVRGSTNVLEGGIVSGTVGCEKFICNNCTFIKNERKDQKMTNTENVSTTESQSLSLCEWVGCSAEYGGAVYVHGNSEATLSVTNSSFQDCNATKTRGGGIYALNIFESSVKHCSFINCSCAATTDYGGAGISMELLLAQPFVENCMFKDGWSGNDAGGVGIYSSKATNTKNCVLDCSFSNCSGHHSGNSDGGGACIWNNLEVIVVRNCLFVNGYSNCWGGGITIQILGANDESHDVLANTFFCGFDETHPCETIGHCISQLIPGYVEDVKILRGTMNIRDEVDAGTNSFAISGLEPTGSAVMTKLNSAGLSLFAVGAGKLNVSDLSVVHDSSRETNRQCRLFEVGNAGVMRMARLNISTDAAHSQNTFIETELILINGGEMEMSFVRWLKISLSTSLFDFSGSNANEVRAGNCSFSGIVRTTAGSSLINLSDRPFSVCIEDSTADGCGSEISLFGGGFMLEIGSEKYVKLNGGIVKNCYASATQGRGGGIGLKVKDISSDFMISSEFEGNRAKWGSDIFVDSINLESTAKSGKITSLTASISTINKIRGFDNGNETVPIPLCVYLISLPEEIVASNVDAFDNSYCGFTEFPCMTLNHSLTRQEEEKKIVIDGMTEVNSELMFDSFKHTIRGKDGNSGWKVIDDSDGSEGSMITVSANAYMMSLIFSVPSALPNHESFFSSTSQSFSLEDCSLTFQGSQSALSYEFLSITAGEVSISSFVVLSLIIGNCPLINLDGNNAAGTFTSMNIEDISSTGNSVLFGVANGASLTSEDSTLSVKASSQADLPSGSIRVISTYSGKSMKLSNNTMSGFKGIEGNGGAIECTLGRDCFLEIVGGLISGCESKGGNGGGLWVEMGEGSRFAVGNVTDASQANSMYSNDENDLFQLVSCKATQTAGGERGYGGGIYLHLNGGASSFILKDVSFPGCDARKGKEIFVNAHDLSGVIDRNSIGFDVDLNNFSKLNGFERSTLNESFVIPLVVYLWNNFSASAFVGEESSSHDFSMCGYEAFPCSTIANAASVHFEGKKKDVTVLEPFVFEEELGFDSEEWSIKAKENEMKCGVADLTEGAQSGLMENTVTTSVTGIVFSISQSLTYHESVFCCRSEKLTLSKCGMEGEAESISAVLVKAVGGVVEVIEFGSESIAKWGFSFFIVEGNSESVPSMNMTNSNFGEISFVDGCVVECHNGNIEEISGCTFSLITRSKGSGGCISITNENDNDGRDHKVEINDCTFEGCAVAGEEEECGGGALFFEASPKTNLVANECTFYGCTAPYEGESVGYGGGIMMKILREEEVNGWFVISSPVFSPNKPNNAKYGKDLFISSLSLASSVKNETLPFVRDRLEMLTEDSLRGYDGGNRECAIPLIYFWKSIGSSVYVAEKGNNVVVCGLEEYPCGSVDYALNRASNLSLEGLIIQGICDVKREIRLSSMKIEGTNDESDKIKFVQAIEGNADVVVECNGVIEFEKVEISIPSSFDNPAKFFIWTGSDSIKASLVCCSIHAYSNAGNNSSFVLILATKGIVQIESTKITELGSMHEIMSISVDCKVLMKNATFEDISLNGGSVFALAETRISGGGSNAADEGWNTIFEQCAFLNVKHSSLDNPSLLCCGEQNVAKLKMHNSTIRDCGSTSSNEGGAVFFGLSEGGLLEINHTNVTECFCSNIGRGGGMFLKSQSVSQKALPFVLSNITFRGNAALKGRDVFVKCTDLDSQITESQFLINFGEPFVKELAIWGCTADNYEDEEDLLGRVYVFRSEFIFVSSIVGNRSDSKNCGEMKSACSSLNVGVSHIIPSDYSQLFVWNETTLTGSCSAQKVTIKSMESNRNAEIKVSEVELAGEEVVRTSESVRFEKVSFVFDGMCNIACSCLIHQLNGFLFLGSVSFLAESGSLWNSQNNLDFSLLTVEDGLLEGSECSICSLQLAKSAFRVLTSESVKFQDLTISNVQCLSSVIECGISQSVSISKLKAENTILQNGCAISAKESSSLLFSLSLSSFANISRSSSGPSVIFTSHAKSASEMFNCSFCECASASAKGSQVAMVSADEMMVDQCKFEGNLAGGSEEMNVAEEGICEWNGSVVDFSDCVAEIRDATVCDSSKGGLTASGGAVTIEACDFNNNNPSILHYPSVRRNIVCSDFGVVDVMSVKGGDGLLPNTSLWILDNECTMKGIAGERPSPLFIPTIESAKIDKKGDEVRLYVKGTLLLPCNVGLKLSLRNGDEERAEKYDFDEYVNESVIAADISSSTIGEEENAEASVALLFGNEKHKCETQHFILKNKSEAQRSGNDKLAEGEMKERSLWSLIIIVIFVVLFLIVLIGFVIFVVRWKKVKNEAEDLREIVNDNIRKDPKAFEMVTMEMSPEEQWRRAENEAEKKNDERMKKRVYEKSLGHSESSEHLLSESGSTEYILGKDSDKIPEWALEKDEEEEIRKRTPSPSISSTSTTDTSDTDSTFVRGEDLCPTTLINVQSGGCDGVFIPS